MTNSELIEKIENATEWNPDDCKELCERAGLAEEWEKADGETFESVIYKAMEILEKEA